MDISVIIPLYNEEESLPELYAWIQRVMNANGFTYEIIFINDGSKDRSWNVIEDLHHKDKEHVHAIKFRRNYGKSPALYCGFKAAKGDVIITMDADLQDSPDEIPELYRMIMNLHDFNCGLKAYRHDVVKNIEVYGEMHRYIPYLAKEAGFSRIGEKVVHHQARKYGKSKFGINRFFNGYLDLLTLWFLTNFGKKPMHVFGLMGSFMFFIGFIAFLWLIVEKLVMLVNGVYGDLLSNHASFFIALVAMILGTQLFLAGFIGDLISRSNPRRNDYQIEKEM